MCGGRIWSRVCVVGGTGVECVWWEDREESVCGGKIGSRVCVVEGSGVECVWWEDRE